MKVKDVFQKELNELTLQDVQDYFKSPLEESNVIEYKSYFDKGQNDYKYKEDKILKTICAFLNSSGGIIIWGAPKEIKDKNGVKKYEDKLSPINTLINRDSFVSKILNRIIPRPLEINCQPIQTGDNESIVVFEIGKSIARPHQFENIYYMRVGEHTVPAPHHYIEALFKQISYPILTAGIELRTDERKIDNEFIYCKINLFINNTSLFQNEINLSISLVVENKYQDLKDEIISVCHYGKPIIRTPIIKIPLYEVNASNMVEVKVVFGGEKSPLRCSRYLLECKITYGYTDHFTERLSKISDIKIVNREENKFYFELDDESFRNHANFIS